MQPTTIALLGGAGRTGRFLLHHLLTSGYHVRALVRHPELFDYAHPALEIVPGDALDFLCITHLLQGCNAVLSTIGQRKDEPLVALQVTAHLLEAMQQASISRYIVLAGVNVDAPGDHKGPAAQQATAWMHLHFPDAHADRQRSFELLQASNLAWTMLRVPFIHFEEGSGNLLVELRDCTAQQVMAGDIARFMVTALQHNRYLRQAPFVSSRSTL
ncbi:NADH-flavin reductase [Chitinophaga parva]|uniref:NADH-flavin reductase n=1 Tax=Chitinophaga parva TaxID=2169414 RepID=A0A2T7BE82_9BACT|nr:NAD(P)H-binding protein [Chitinophaga parva]PUZ23340.1 NADH-flavin reductase [Chitinophaga parva]